MRRLLNLYSSSLSANTDAQTIIDVASIQLLALLREFGRIRPEYDPSGLFLTEPCPHESPVMTEIRDLAGQAIRNLKHLQSEYNPASVAVAWHALQATQDTLNLLSGTTNAEHESRQMGVPAQHALAQSTAMERTFEILSALEFGPTLPHKSENSKKLAARLSNNTYRLRLALGRNPYSGRPIPSQDWRGGFQG